MPVTQRISTTINDLERQAQPGEVLSTKTFRRVLKPFFGALKQLEPIDPGVLSFVHDELKLPWPWVTIELLQKLVLATWELIYGGPPYVTYQVEQEDPPAPDLFTFEVQPGETITAARQRFVDEANTTLTRPPRGCPRCGSRPCSG